MIVKQSSLSHIQSDELFSNAIEIPFNILICKTSSAIRYKTLNNAISNKTNNSNNAKNWAAEPTSLAILASGCCSVEVWSTQASIPVLNSSTISDRNETINSSIFI